MIWDDPWIRFATQPGGTRIPPPRSPLAAGHRFICATAESLDVPTWIDLVGTRWTAADVVERLRGAYIPCLYVGDDLVATCVFRPIAKAQWVLETLRARKGFGGPLLRAAIPWLSDRGPFTMSYTWELSGPGLLAAWWRGWLSSATSLQYGWAWSPGSDPCNFCPKGWEPLGPRPTLPILFRNSAIISDSGLGDGWGYVSVYRGSPDWSAIKGWRALWMRSATQPKGWTWTGEFVIVGSLSYGGQPAPGEWTIAEITSSQ